MKRKDLWFVLLNVAGGLAMAAAIILPLVNAMVNGGTLNWWVFACVAAGMGMNVFLWVTIMVAVFVMAIKHQ